MDAGIVGLLVAVAIVAVALLAVRPRTVLRSIMKGRSITLRARLPGWKKFTDVAELPHGFQHGKVFCAGRWYPVKSTYRVTPAKAGAQRL